MLKTSSIHALCAGALGLLAAGGAHAEDPTSVSEVIVTAQKVQQRLVDVPVSIAVFGRGYFENTRTSSLEDLSHATPGLIVNESVGASYGNVAIRGIGSDALNNGVEPSVGVFVDGVYQARPAFLSADLFDVERVEVLRGPQGTLYGKNTDAGAINVISRSPTDRFEGRARAYVGDFNAVSLQGSVSGPVAKGVRARLAAYSDTRDGYIRNTVSGTGGNDFQRYGARVRVDADLSERLTVNLNGAYDVNNSSVINYALLRSSPTLSAIAGAFGVKLPSDVYARTAAANFKPHERFNMFRGSLTGVYDLGGGSQFTSITAYQGFHDNNISDVDYTALDMLDGGNITYQKQYSQEFRFNNDPNARFSYLAGAFFFRQTMKDRGFNTVRPALTIVTGGAFPSGAQDLTMTSTSVQSAALFGQASYKVTEKFTATVGVRFDEQDNRHTRLQPKGVTIPNLGALNLKKSESNVSGSASVRYAFNRDLNGYATVSRGYKGGGYNGFGVASATEIGFRPETATNYEMGLKGYALDRRVTFDITAFHMEMSDLQVSNFDGANFVVGNAAAATTQGVELNVSASPTQELTLNFGLSYDEATYDSYPGAPCTAAQKLATAPGVPCTQNLAGRQIANAPKLHGTLSAQYEHLFEAAGFAVFGRVDYAYLSKQYLQTALSPATLQKGYGLLNGRLGVRTADQRWGLFLTGSNIGNTKYLRNAYDYPLFTGAYLAAPNRPRTWGVELQAAF